MDREHSPPAPSKTQLRGPGSSFSSLCSSPEPWITHVATQRPCGDGHHKGQHRLTQQWWAPRARHVKGTGGPATKGTGRQATQLSSHCCVPGPRPRWSLAAHLIPLCTLIIGSEMQNPSPAHGPTSNLGNTIKDGEGRWGSRKARGEKILLKPRCI